MAVPYSIAHEHPEEECHQTDKSVRRRVPGARVGKMAVPYSIAHEHPEEECQQKQTGARRASRGEGHSPTRSHSSVPRKNAAMRCTIIWKIYNDNPNKLKIIAKKEKLIYNSNWSY